MELDYDPADKNSILQAAKKLTGKTLNESCIIPEEIQNKANKGDLGTLVENYYFGIHPGNSPNPDFAEADLELKTTGLVKRNGRLVAKERLVLNMINFDTMAEESWANSTFVKKCASILILFYEYIKEKSVIDRKFIIDPKILEVLKSQDAVQIQKDWEFIKNKIRAGLAHELSEGDTYYLGACRKGSGGPDEKLRSQPYSDIPAKARALSLKQGYVQAILDSHLSELESVTKGSKLTVQDAVLERFSPYVGMTLESLAKELDRQKTSSNQKGFHRGLAERMLSESGSSVIELVKAGIEMKTIRVNKTWRPNEAMSFPGFKFLELVDEEWEDSSFAKKIEQKFLFVIFRTGDDGIERLEKVAFWNMPYADREEARRVFEETKRRVSINAKDLPKASESAVAHVRPKARDASDVIPTPQGDFHVKQCFWLNQNYIEKVIQGL